MKKRIIASLMVAAMAVTGLAGCGSSGNEKNTTDTVANETNETSSSEGVASESSDSSESIELTYVFADGDEGAKISMNEIVERFNESHENITIRIEPGNGGAYSEFLKTKDSVGEFPDIMEMRDTAMYVRAGKLEPLSEEVTSLFTSTMDFGGSVYTVPLAGENTNGIIYNKKYFDENGFTEPTTYEEFIELCEAIKEKGDMAPLVVGGQDIWHMGFLFDFAYTDQVISQDTEFIKNCYEETKDFSDETFKAVFEEMMEIMQYAQDGWVSTPDAQITTFLVSDMAAMLYSGTHMFSQIAGADSDFEIGWFPIPCHDDKIRLVGGSGASGLSISAEAAQDPARKAAAEEFIKFFYQPENYKVYCEKLSAIPLTVEQPDMEVLPVFQEVIDANLSADELSPMWNSRIGENELPPDFRNFTYKTLIEVVRGVTSIDAATEELNKSWEVAMRRFNPLTGVGIDSE